MKRILLSLAVLVGLYSCSSDDNKPLDAFGNPVGYTYLDNSKIAGLYFRISNSDSILLDLRNDTYAHRTFDKYTKKELTDSYKNWGAYRIDATYFYRIGGKGNYSLNGNQFTLGNVTYTKLP